MMKKTTNQRKSYKKPENELKYYGFYACLRLWEMRPQDVLRVYVEDKRMKEITPLLKWCASKSKPYSIISSEEMCKVADSIHHEGLCIVARELVTLKFSDLLQTLQETQKPICLVYLDGVQNPHNIGSIMRVCAHFGVTHILGERNVLPKISPSTYRIAQGGAEHVKLVSVDHPEEDLKKLEKLGCRIVTSSSHGGKSLYSYKFAPRTLLILGSESEGVKSSLLRLTKDTLLIPGSGLVESLNVSVATGLFLGEYYRQIHARL